MNGFDWVCVGILIGVVLTVGSFFAIYQAGRWWIDREGIKQVEHYANTASEED